MQVYTFTAAATSEAVQADIDAGDGTWTVVIPWNRTREYEDVTPGDGAVIDVANPADQSSWLGDVTDVEHEDGYPMTVTIEVR